MTACVVHDWGQIAKALIVVAAVMLAVALISTWAEQDRTR